MYENLQHTAVCNAVYHSLCRCVRPACLPHYLFDCVTDSHGRTIFSRTPSRIYVISSSPFLKDTEKIPCVTWSAFNKLHQNLHSAFEILQVRAPALQQLVSVRMLIWMKGSADFEMAEKFENDSSFSIWDHYSFFILLIFSPEPDFHPMPSDAQTSTTIYPPSKNIQIRFITLRRRIKKRHPQV